MLPDVKALVLVRELTSYGIAVDWRLRLDGDPARWRAYSHLDPPGEVRAGMGRHTYDGFAPVWAARSGDDYSDRINSMAKYVVSSTLRDPEWTNTTVIDGDVVAEIARLKERPGKDIVQYGFGRLSYTLMDHGLLDELRLWVHPFFVRRGRPQDLLFREGPLTRLDLAGAQTLESGVVILTYHRP